LESCQVGTTGEEALLSITLDPDSSRLESPHIEDEELEEYSFDRLAEPRLAEVERHLNVCAQCRTALAQVDEFIFISRRAAEDRERLVAASGRAAPSRFRTISSTAWISTAWIAATAAVLLAAGVYLERDVRSPGLPPVTIVLVAERGGNAFGIAHAPAGAPLTLDVDTRGLPAVESLRVEIVDASGRRVWQGPLPPKLAAGLGRGRYWVRLYVGRTDLLREFGLELK
jgi:hypothetical protein